MTLSPLALSALGVLREGPMHPYEIYRLMLERWHDRVVKLRPGTLYHAVGRLADAGLVTAVGTDRDGNRPERTTYAITDAGRAALEHEVRHLAAHPVYEYPSFPVALSELHSLSAADAEAVLRSRLTVLEAERSVQERAIETLRSRRMPAPYWLDVGYQHAQLRAEIAWITSLLDDLAAGVVDWDERTPPSPADDDVVAPALTAFYPDLAPRKVAP